MTSTPVAQPPKSSASFSGDKELKISLGMNASALNFGVQLEMPQGQGTAFGGYLFNQSEKDTANIAGVLALGGQFCLDLLNSGKNTVYVAPGFGFFKSESNGESETALGPSLRLGVNWILQNGGGLGLERFEVYNWTSSEASGSAAYYSAVYSFGF